MTVQSVIKILRNVMVTYQEVACGAGAQVLRFMLTLESGLPAAHERICW